MFSCFELEKWVEQSMFATKIGNLGADGHLPTVRERVDAAPKETRNILSNVWEWVIVGVGIRAVIRGWAPAEFFVTYFGPDNPLGFRWDPDRRPAVRQRRRSGSHRGGPVEQGMPRTRSWR